MKEYSAELKKIVDQVEKTKGMTKEEQIIIEEAIEELSGIIRSLVEEGTAEKLLEKARDIGIYITMATANYEKGVRQLSELLCLLFVIGGIADEQLSDRGDGRKQDHSIPQV